MLNPPVDGKFKDTCLTADPGVVSSIPAQAHTFVEIDHEINSTVIHLPSAVSKRAVSYKQKYVHKVLVNSPGKKCGIFAWKGVSAILWLQIKFHIPTNVSP